MKNTVNLNLKKPDQNDFVNIGDINDNMDILDAEVAKKYVKPLAGIPFLDLDSATQAALKKAETALQTVTKSSVGLGNVDNTSDINKPVSTAQQVALDKKANLASPSLTGTPTAPTAAESTNTQQIATTAFVDRAVKTHQADSVAHISPVERSAWNNKANNSDLTKHEKDYTKHSVTATTTNVGNIYSIAVTDITTLIDYMSIVIKVNANSSGPCFLRINNMENIAIVKANGNAVTNLKANGIYTLRYNATTKNFILQVDGGDDRLKGKWVNSLVVPPKTTVYRSSAIAHDNRIFLFGGAISTSGSTSKIQEYNIDDATWSDLPSTIYPLSEGTSCVKVQSKIFLSGTSSSALDFIEFDLTTKTTTKKANSLSNSRKPGLVFLNGNIYHIPYRSLYKYDINTNTWSALSSIPASADTNSIAVCANLTDYTFVAFTYTYNTVNYTYTYTPNVYNVLTNVWTQLSNFTTRSPVTSAVTVDSVVYLFNGGRFLEFTNNGSVTEKEGSINYSTTQGSNDSTVVEHENILHLICRDYSSGGPSNYSQSYFI